MVALAPGMALLDDGEPRSLWCSEPALAVGCPVSAPTAPSVARPADDGGQAWGWRCAAEGPRVAQSLQRTRRKSQSTAAP